MCMCIHWGGSLTHNWIMNEEWAASAGHQDDYDLLEMIMMIIMIIMIVTRMIMIILRLF